MKLLNKISVILILMSSSINYSQVFDGYKYFVIGNLVYTDGEKDKYGIQSSVADFYKSTGYYVITGGDNIWSESLYPKDLKFNYCKAVFIEIEHKSPPPYEVTLKYRNCKGETIKRVSSKVSNGFNNALKKIYAQLLENNIYSYDESLTPKKDYPPVENINKSENELKAYFDLTKLDPIEGIYKTYKSAIDLKLAIIKVGEVYKAITLNPEASHWEIGDIKMILESTATEGVFSAKWYSYNKSNQETFVNLEGGLITIEVSDSVNEDNKSTINLLKIYPKS